MHGFKDPLSVGVGLYKIGLLLTVSVVWMLKLNKHSVISKCAEGEYLT